MSLPAGHIVIPRLIPTEPKLLGPTARANTQWPTANQVAQIAAYQITGRPGIMGGMAESARGAWHLPPARHALGTLPISCLAELDRRPRTLVGMPLSGRSASLAAGQLPALMFTTLVSLAGILLVRPGLAVSGRAGRASGAVSSRSGQPQCLLLIPRRGRREPGEPSRPDKSLTHPPGVDSLIDVGG